MPFAVCSERAFTLKLTVLTGSTLPTESVDRNWSSWTPPRVVETVVPFCHWPPSSENCVEATPDPASVALSVTVAVVV